MVAQTLKNESDNLLLLQLDELSCALRKRDTASAPEQNDSKNALQVSRAASKPAMIHWSLSSRWVQRKTTLLSKLFDARTIE